MRIILISLSAAGLPILSAVGPQPMQESIRLPAAHGFPQLEAQLLGQPLGRARNSHPAALVYPSFSVLQRCSPTSTHRRNLSAGIHLRPPKKSPKSQRYRTRRDPHRSASCPPRRSLAQTSVAALAALEIGNSLQQMDSAKSARAVPSEDFRVGTCHSSNSTSRISPEVRISQVRVRMWPCRDDGEYLPR